MANTADEILSQIDTIVDNGQVYVPAEFINAAVQGIGQAALEAYADDEINLDKRDGVLVALERMGELADAAILKHAEVPNNVSALE